VIEIGRGRPIFDNTRSLTLRLLFLNALQLLNRRNTTAYNAHHFLKPQFLLFPETLNFRIGGTTLFFSALNGFLKLAELSTDTNEVVIRRTLNVTARATGTNTFRTSRGITVGDPARLDASLLTVGAGQHLDRTRKDGKKESVTTLGGRFLRLLHNTVRYSGLLQEQEEEGCYSPQGVGAT
jgi:hypothetical protein